MIIREELMKAASNATGLNDFGDDSFQEALNRLICSYNTEADLSDVGLYSTRNDLINDLSGRLHVVNGLKNCPEALNANIKQPVFILGLPRTGTTTLHNIIQTHSDCQVLEHWLASAPRSRPLRQQWPNEADYQKSVQKLDLQYQENPTLRAQHDISAGSADECRFVLRHLFLDDSYGYVCHLPSYRKWYEQQPMKPLYEWHRDVLKLIQYPNDIHRFWVLKYPSHLANIKEIFDVYPDACIIQTHRDPVATIPSFASLITSVGAAYSDSMDPNKIGRFMSEHWYQRIEKATETRDELKKEDQFYDLQFDEVLRDPVASIKLAFNKFDLPFSETTEREMRTWHKYHPLGRYGAHDYTTKDFGLNNKFLSELFQNYRKKYKITQLKI